MSLGMGLIGGIGKGVADIADANTKAWAEEDRSEATARREQALARFKVELQNEPLNRLGVQAKALIGEQIPVGPEPVKNLTGAGVTYPDGTPSSGLQGDPAKLRAQALALPEGEDKTNILAQLDRQMAADREKNLQAVIGKTRTRTPDEALTEAANRAKVEDPVAYAEYESKIGKPQRDERRIDAQDRKEENRAAANATAEERKAATDARRYEVELKRLELQAGSLEANNRKIDAWIENEAAKRDRDEAKLNNPKPAAAERMGSIINAMNATLKSLDDNRPRATDSEEAKADWKAQRENAFAVRARATAKLNSNLDDGSEKPSTAPKPTGAIPSLPAGAKKVGTSGGKVVWETPDGQRFVEN